MALISKGNVMLLDQEDCTGICVSEDYLYRNVIVGSGGSKNMQLHSYSITQGKKVLAVDKHYDFHDVLLHKDQLYLVSTGTNEVIVLDKQGNEIRRHIFPGHNDSWHINCLGVWNDEVVLSAFGAFESHRGYKNHSHNHGFVMALEGNAKLWEGLSQPHTPAQYDNKLFICNSEEKQILIKDDNGKITCLQLDGYTRGLAFSESYIYIGLSESRNITATATTSSYARIVAVDSLNLERQGEIHLPFSEIYDIRLISRDNILPTLMTSINNIELKNKLETLHFELANVRAQFQRINNHFISGPVIRLLRWLKSDASFGNPDINQPSN